jgi:nicotinamide riboside transporter PnuC
MNIPEGFMCVAPITYVYLILSLTDFLCIVLAISRRNWCHLEVLIPTLFFLLIGFSFNFQINVFIYDVGY